MCPHPLLLLQPHLQERWILRQSREIDLLPTLTFLVRPARAVPSGCRRGRIHLRELGQIAQAEHALNHDAGPKVSRARPEKHQPRAHMEDIRKLLANGREPASVSLRRLAELVARPLISLWWPELAGVVQPLAGEWAARRSLMESLSIPVGYGVELATLMDTAARHGLDAVAQVDLGTRAHRHQGNHDLALMAAELLVVAERRRPGGPLSWPRQWTGWS